MPVAKPVKDVFILPRFKAGDGIEIKVTRNEYSAREISGVMPVSSTSHLASAYSHMNRLPAHQSTGADGTKSAIPSNMIEHTES